MIGGDGEGIEEGMEGRGREGQGGEGKGEGDVEDRGRKTMVERGGERPGRMKGMDVVMMMRGMEERG